MVAEALAHQERAEEVEERRVVAVAVAEERQRMRFGEVGVEAVAAAVEGCWTTKG